MNRIRFIDSKYRTLFKINDGDKIKIKSDNGEKVYICRYIDDYHFKIFGNGRVFHICEFAEQMKRNGTTYEPAE